jgi:hypothetical protein
MRIFSAGLAETPGALLLRRLPPDAAVVKTGLLISSMMLIPYCRSDATTDERLEIEG